MDIKDLNYVRIAELLATESAGTGAYSRIPSERELAERHNCSRVTIRKALEVLEQRGCISRVKGQGTFWVEADTVKKPAVEQKNWQIAIVIFNFGLQDGLLQFLNGVEHANRNNHNYTYQFWHIDYSLNDKVDQFSGMAEADGYIVAGDFRLADLSWFISTRKPLVVVGQAIDQALLLGSALPFSLIKLDMVRGWEMAAEHLLMEGYKRPAVLVASRHQGYADRHEGVLQALKRFNLPEENCCLVICNPNTDRGAVLLEELCQGTRQLLDRMDEFDCLLTTLEPILIVTAAQERGLKNGDLFPMVVECNQSPLTPRFLGADILSDDMEAIGMQAATQLLNLLEGISGFTVVNICPSLKRWRKNKTQKNKEA